MTAFIIVTPLRVTLVARSDQYFVETVTVSTSLLHIDLTTDWPRREKTRTHKRVMTDNCVYQSTQREHDSLFRSLDQ